MAKESLVPESEALRKEVYHDGKETKNFVRERKCSIKEKGTALLFVSAAAVNLLAFSDGCHLAWTSATVPRLKSNNTLVNPLGDNPATVSDISLIAGSYFVGSVVGCLIPAKILDSYGRKPVLALVAALMSVASIVLAFAGSVWLYCICRLILGMEKTATFILIPIYIGEIAHKGNRGRFSFYLPMFLAMGFVYSYITGAQFSTRVYTLLCTVPILLSLMLILLVVPESPYFLVAKNRPRHEVAEVLGKLRSSDDLAEELKQIEDAVIRRSSSGGQKSSTYLDLFRDRASRRAFIIATAALIFHLFSGVAVIHSFLAPILDKVTGAYFTGNTSAITISLVKLFSTGIGSMAVERFGRKPLLIWSAVSVALCHIVLGVYFQLQDLDYDFVSALSPLPLVCLVLFAVVYSLGIGTVPFAYLSEFYPQHAKNVGVPLSTAIGALLNAFIIFGFPYFMEYFGMQWCFWLFAVSCVCCALFTKYMVPETKGKTLDEIQRILEKRCLCYIKEHHYVKCKKLIHTAFNVQNVQLIVTFDKL